MNSDDIRRRNRVIGGKATPGSREAREQYKQIRLLLLAQWVATAIFVGFAIYLPVSWVIFALLAVACLIGIPGQRKYLARLRENAYPKGSPGE